MKWKEHYALTGKHAFLGASSHSWLNYTDAKMEQVFLNNLKKQEGTELHALASSCIIHRVKLAQLKKALNMFVNDAIGFGMESEQVLYYSDNCFGTADAIQFKDNLLRVHDLKTGDGPVKRFYQLDIYCALFCLEYGINPLKINFVERLYQGRDFTENVPDKDYIREVMDKIVQFDSLINRVREEIK